MLSQHISQFRLKDTAHNIHKNSRKGNYTVNNECLFFSNTL